MTSTRQLRVLRTMPIESPGPGRFLLRGLLPLDRNQLPRDIVAGITLAALAIPEVMGYTKIAGTPVVTGLYTLLLPVIAYALLGGSRHLVVAADSATAAILASMLAVVAAVGTPDYVALTSLVALVVAAMLVLARIFRLGFLSDFLSRSALIGFLTGVGMQVAGGELAGLFGLPKEGHGTPMQIASVFARLGSFHLATFGISAAVLGVIVGCSRWMPRVPGALLAVVGAIVASASLDFAGLGIATVGIVPSGLPSVTIPTFRWHEFYQVLVTAGSCFIVIVAQSAATSRAYALRYEEQFEENLDLIGLAAANAAAAVSGTFVVNGSPTKTEMVDEAGGRSQVSQLIAAVVVVIVLLVLTGPLGFLPNAVLSAIVFLIGVKLIDVKGMQELFRLQRNEFWIALVTAATVVFVSVMIGIAVAVFLSLLDHVRHAYRPRTRVLVKDDQGHWSPLPAEPDLLAAPGIVAYRFEANLFYANSGRFMQEVLQVVSGTKTHVHTFILDATGIDDVDYSGTKMLLQLRNELWKRGVCVCVANPEGVADNLRRYGLLGGPGGWDLHATLDEAIARMSAPRDPPTTK